MNNENEKNMPRVEDIPVPSVEDILMPDIGADPDNPSDKPGHSVYSDDEAYQRGYKAGYEKGFQDGIEQTNAVRSASQNQYAAQSENSSGSSTMAWIAIVLGVLAVLFPWGNLLMAWLCVIAAAVAVFLAVQSRKKGHTGGLQTTGLTVAIISLCISGLTAVSCTAFAGCVGCLDSLTDQLSIEMQEAFENGDYQFFQDDINAFINGSGNQQD